MKKILLFLIGTCLFAQSHSVTLSWTNAVGNATGTTTTIYKLAGACPSTPPTSITGSGFTLLTSGLTGTSYVDTAVSATLSYCYFGVTTIGTTTSGLSNDAGATVPGSFPPQMFSAVAN